MKATRRFITIKTFYELLGFKYFQLALKVLIQHLKSNNIFCKPESINTNISHQLFDYLIIFVNLQQ